MPQVVEFLGISLATAERRWTYAKAWLLAELRPATNSPCPGHDGADRPDAEER